MRITTCANAQGGILLSWMMIVLHTGMLTSCTLASSNRNHNNNPNYSNNHNMPPPPMPNNQMYDQNMYGSFGSPEDEDSDDIIPQDQDYMDYPDETSADATPGYYDGNTSHMYANNNPHIRNSNGSYRDGPMQQQSHPQHPSMYDRPQQSLSSQSEDMPALPGEELYGASQQFQQQQQRPYPPIQNPYGQQGGVSRGPPPETSESSGGNVLSSDLSQFDKDVIFTGLKRMYRKKILPLELASKFGHFHSPVSVDIFSLNSVIW